MTELDPQAVVQWPAPMLAPVADAREKLVEEALMRLQLHPVTPHELRGKKGWRERFAIIKEALRVSAEVLIPFAERLVTATGAEKKSLVRKELIAVFKAVEKRINLLPGPVEVLAWWAIERAIDGIIETVFRQLDKRGIVNVGRA